MPKQQTEERRGMNGARRRTLNRQCVSITLALKTKEANRKKRAAKRTKKYKNI